MGKTTTSWVAEISVLLSVWLLPNKLYSLIQFISKAAQMVNSFFFLLPSFLLLITAYDPVNHTYKDARQSVGSEKPHHEAIVGQRGPVTSWSLDTI